MHLVSVINVELVKLYHRRLTLLLILLLVPAVLFGVGMASGMTFVVSDGIEEVQTVETKLSAVGFAVQMLEQSKYLIYLVVIILAAVSLAGELENGQLALQIIRVCSRRKIFIAKYIALLLYVNVAILGVFIWSLFIYGIFVRNTVFASNKLWDAQIWAQMGYLVFTLVGVAVAIAVTLLLGTRLKIFSCFACSYIGWFISLYTDFLERVKLFIPYNMPNHLLAQGNKGCNCLPYVGVYVGYCLIIAGCACVIFQGRDIKK